MLGQQVGEIKGVLDADGRVMETSVAANGNFVGSQVNVTLTYTSKLVTNGVLHGWGNGVLMTTGWGYGNIYG
jgi:hypothetical protein